MISIECKFTLVTVDPHLGQVPTIGESPILSPVLLDASNGKNVPAARLKPRGLIAAKSWRPGSSWPPLP
jgi:hypothetical protein